MAYSDRTHYTHDPYAHKLGADPTLRPPRSSGGAVAGLGVAVGLILLVIVGTSFLGGNPDTAATGEAPAAATAPAGDVAPTAPEGTAAPAE